LELDESGQPTQQIIERRRRAEFITPIPKPKKRRGSPKQEEIIFDEGKGLSTKEQQYDATSIINELAQRLHGFMRGLQVIERPQSLLWLGPGGSGRPRQKASCLVRRSFGPSP
jgi:hypothetical protein